jgi:hypothetical protein
VAAELMMGIAFLCTAGVLFLADFVIGPISALLMSAARFAILFVARQMRSTEQVTAALGTPESDALFAEEVA